ncbi:MAG: hypothetical protein H7257_11475 [Taibaiella sp.]|nr:hypothetical protein [Taibaiella sp.]
MPIISSVGKCFFCNVEYKKAGISKHLNTHLAKENKGEGNKTSFHIRIDYDPSMAGFFFLNLWVDGDSYLSDIDDFLRKIWLECCGHMSAFTNAKDGERYSMYEINDMESDMDDCMNSAIKNIFTKGTKLKYEYDSGNTTTLILKVLERLPVEVPGGIILLSRNEPLEIMCEVCKSAPAVTMCTTCYDPNTFCTKCAKKHAMKCEDFEEYSSLPVVNSPRMGICAYYGGTIDNQRDGVFVKK